MDKHVKMLVDIIVYQHSIIKAYEDHTKILRNLINKLASENED